MTKTNFTYQGEEGEDMSGPLGSQEHKGMSC